MEEKINYDSHLREMQSDSHFSVIVILQLHISMLRNIGNSMHEGLKIIFTRQVIERVCENKQCLLCKNIDKHGHRLKGETKKLTCNCDDCERFFAIKIFLFYFYFT